LGINLSMNTLPTDYIYYVYKHVDPRTDELLYIGHGARGRAWIHGSKLSVLRSQEHLNHLESMTLDGFIASDWVHVVQQGVSKKDACVIEQTLIRELKPLYNLPQGKSLLKLDGNKLKTCRSLKDTGLSYLEIGLIVGVSTMTVYRALNGQTKNLQEENTHD
jgi:hypothetical protein